MYNWNRIKIQTGGTAHSFISDIGKYFHASNEKSAGQDYDIGITINNPGNLNLLPSKLKPKLLKSCRLLVEEEINLEIYQYGQKIFYIYKDMANILVDSENNSMVISLAERLFCFGYYNALLFFLYPLGRLLENLGYRRVHASCVNFGGSSVVFTGVSGSGKSTSAFALAASGANIISDDVTFFKKKGNFYHTYTVSRLAKLDRVSVNKYFPQFLKHEHIESSNGEIYFNIDDLNINMPDNTRLEAIVILNKTFEEESSIAEVHPSKVVPHIFPSSIGLNSENTDKKFNFLAELLDKVSCYRADFGTDMKHFGYTIKNILDNGNL